MQNKREGISLRSKARKYTSLSGLKFGMLSCVNGMHWTKGPRMRSIITYVEYTCLDLTLDFEFPVGDLRYTGIGMEPIWDATCIGWGSRHCRGQFPKTWFDHYGQIRKAPSKVILSYLN